MLEQRIVLVNLKSSRLAMHITVTSATGDTVFPLEIPSDLGVADFKAFCEAQSDIPAAEMVLLFNGKPMDDDNKKGSKRLDRHLFLLKFRALFST